MLKFDYHNRMHVQNTTITHEMTVADSTDNKASKKRSAQNGEMDCAERV